MSWQKGERVYGVREGDINAHKGKYTFLPGGSSDREEENNFLKPVERVKG